MMDENFAKRGRTYVEIELENLLEEEFVQVEMNYEAGERTYIIKTKDGTVATIIVEKEMQ